MPKSDSPGPMTVSPWQPASTRRRDALLETPVLLLMVFLASLVLFTVGRLVEDEGRVVSLMAFLPPIVAVIGSVRQTVLTAVWSTGTLFVVLLGIRLDVGEVIPPTFATALMSALSIGACRYRIHRNAEVSRLRSAAAALQRQLLRPLPFRTPEVIIDGLYQPVEEDSMVGGDIYEIAMSPYGTRVLIADVQGKGLPAIGTAFSVLGAFREAAQREPDLLGVVDALESAVERHNSFASRTGEPERFVTALVLTFDERSCGLVVNCGHLLPCLVCEDPDESGPLPLADPGVPLGLIGLSPEPRRIEEFDLPEGNTLLLFTDGVTDARDPFGVFYPLRERLREWSGIPTSELAATIAADLQRFTGNNQRDDIALLALHRVPAPVPGGEGDGRGPGTAAGGGEPGPGGEAGASSRFTTGGVPGVPDGTDRDGGTGGGADRSHAGATDPHTDRTGA